LAQTFDFLGSPGAREVVELGEQVRPQHLICLVRPKLTVGCAARSPGRRSVNR
jgi:hypothetical protein